MNGLLIDAHPVSSGRTYFASRCSGQTHLASTPDSGVADGAADSVTVDATNGDDVVTIVGSLGLVSVGGLAASVDIVAADPTDTLLALGLDGDDVVDGTALAAGAINLTADGGNGDDILLGGAGADVLAGGAGDDVLLGGPGQDTPDGGTGNNIRIQDGPPGGQLSSQGT